MFWDLRGGQSWDFLQLNPVHMRCLDAVGLPLFCVMFPLSKPWHHADTLAQPWKG